MRREFRMPDAGEGLTEAEVLAWRVAPGDVVEPSTRCCWRSRRPRRPSSCPVAWAGTVGQLLAGRGRTVAVGEPIIAIETAEAGAGAGATAAGGSAAPVATEATEAAGAKIGEAGVDGRIATLVGYGPRPGSVQRRPRRAHAPSQWGGPPPIQVQQGGTADVQVQQGGTAATSPAPARTPTGLVPLAKPPVRKLARDLGVDLRTLTGTGPGGVITREDVEAAVAAPAASPKAAPALAAPTPADRREPIRGVRKATAAAMVASAFTAPHVTEFLAVDVTATMALRDRLRASREYAEVKLTPLAFVAKAVCHLAARRTPEVNASWDEAAGEIVYHGRVQLGIAAATPRGLIVPKIRDADTLGLRELADALADLTATARAGATPPTALVGGTFTITNVGVFGVDSGPPIINPGESAILAVGSIKPTPWVVDGELAVRTVCRLALSFDHRIVDGEQGSRFLADIGALLTVPGLAMTW